MVQGEVDITDNITAYGALGWHHSEIDFRYLSPIVINVQRDTGRHVRFWAAALTRTAQDKPAFEPTSIPARQPFPEHELFRGQPAERQRLLRPAPFCLFKSLQSCGLTFANTPLFQTRHDRHEIIEHWLVRHHVHLQQRIQLTVGARRQTYDLTSTRISRQHDDISTYEEVDLEPGLCHRGEAAGKRFAIRQLYRGTSARKVVVGILHQCGPGLSSLPHDAERGRRQSRFRPHYDDSGRLRDHEAVHHLGRCSPMRCQRLTASSAIAA